MKVVSRSARRGLALVAAAGMAFSSSAMGLPVASAHDVVVGSTPSDGGTVDNFPRVITLEFSGIPQGSFNTVAVSREGTGEVLFKGEPQLVEQKVSLETPEGVDPGPGTYLVGFQITSSDGHATRGKTTFTVAGAAESSAATPTVAQDSMPQDVVEVKTSRVWLGKLALAVVIVLLVVSVLVFLKKRKA